MSVASLNGSGDFRVGDVLGRAWHLLTGNILFFLLVPAVISLFGRWNWWLPARPARWLRVAPSLPGREAIPAADG